MQTQSFNTLAHGVDGLVISAAPGASGVCNITFSFTLAGAPIQAPLVFFLWLSDAATGGSGLTSTAASGAVAVGSLGSDLGDIVAKKSKLVATSGNGVYVLSITDSSKSPFIPTVSIPGRPAIFVGPTLQAGDYGA
jgi:hypothetical protein